MILSNASIRRPIAMSCLVIGLALLGMNSARQMGLELLPMVDVPFITVMTIYPGATPAEIETDVAKRIEDAVVTIEGLKHVSSSCMESACQTFLEFEIEVDVDVVANDVREKLDLIRADLPEDVEDPRIEKFDVNSKPVVNLALTGDAPPDELYDYADNELKDRITTIRGVASVDVIGGSKRQVEVRLDRRKLAGRGLTSMDVVKAVSGGVRAIPSGNLKDGPNEYTVRFDAEYEGLGGIAGLEIANKDGQRCRIGDVGEVVMGTGETRQMANIDGRRCVAIRVIKKADANAVSVVSRVREAMESLEAELPGGMELVWVNDDGRFIEATNSSAWVNVGQGVVLTALILFVFLYNVRGLFVVGITMPLTIVIGMFFMYMLDFTLNSSTLIAIGMSVGILVTNSIVVMEAIVKRMAGGGDAKSASSLGAGEAFIAVLASAGTNVVVLFPLATMGGMVGMFIRPLAMTMVIMTVVSLFISFTLTPLLCSVLLRPGAEKAGGVLGRMERGWNRGFEALTRVLRRVLEFNERHKWAAVGLLVGVVAMFASALKVAGSVGTTMVKQPDQGQILLKLEFPTRYNIESTTARVEEAERRLGDLPELKHMLTMVGKVEGVIGQSAQGVHLAQMLLRFSDRDGREESIDELLGEVWRRMGDYPGAIVTATVPDIVGGQAVDIEMEISGGEFKKLDELALATKEAVSGIAGITSPDTTVREGKGELRIHPRREVLSDIGMPATGLGINLRANLEGITAGTYKESARNYDIVVKLAEEEGRGQVEEFMVGGARGRTVILSSLAEVEETQAAVQLTRKDKQRISKFVANLDRGLALGTAVGAISRAVDEKVGMPPGYRYKFSGMYEMMKEGQGALVEAMLVAVVLVVLTLAAILESFKQPFLILATLPPALIGVFWALGAAGASLDIFAIMGCVMLVGIVVNNAILIMDQFNVHVGEGVPRHKAMITATCERFRPIVMITLAAVLGMLPLALGRGIGSELRNGVGIAAVGGILVSGILTLFVMPVLYDLFTRKSNAGPDGGTFVP